MSIEETQNPPAPENAAAAAQPPVAAPVQTEGSPAPSDAATPPAESTDARSDPRPNTAKPAETPAPAISAETRSSAEAPGGQAPEDGSLAPAAAASTEAAANAVTASAAPEPLPAPAQAVDDQIRAALIMVAHGIARLSKLAGNIRFGYLQRDESRLINERKQLKADFQAGKSSETELLSGLQALLQKVERQAGALLVPPGRSVEGGEPAPALSSERINQLRRALREAMMSLAAAAPLHLQIELSPQFSEPEPDVMAMAARVHALHRLVLGSLKSIRWNSPLHCTLSFDDGKETKTIDLQFGEQGVIDLPEAYRQNQSQATSTRPGPRPAQQQGRRPGGKAQPAAGAGGNRPNRPRRDKPTNSQGADQSASPNRVRPQGTQTGEAGRAAQAGEQRPGQPRHRGQRPRGAEGGKAAHPANPSSKDNGRPPHGKRPGAASRPAGNDARSSRPQKNFPSNSAMADKLRAALGGQSLGSAKGGKR